MTNKEHESPNIAHEKYPFPPLIRALQGVMPSRQIKAR